MELDALSADEEERLGPTLTLSAEAARDLRAQFGIDGDGLDLWRWEQGCEGTMMNRLNKSGQDGLSRVAMLLTLSPIGVAVALMIAGVFLRAASSVPVALIVAVSSAVLILAAAGSLLIFDHVVVRDLRRVAVYLRAARHGEDVRAPLGIGGVLAELLEAAEDVVQNQIHLARTISHLTAVQQSRDWIEHATHDQQEQQALISRALLGFGDKLKALTTSPSDTWVDAVADRVEQRVSRSLAERRESSGLKPDLDSLRRTLQAVHEEMRTIGADVKALGGETRASARGVLEALPGLLATRAKTEDQSSDPVLDRLQKLELVLTAKVDALARSGDLGGTDNPIVGLTRDLVELRAAIENRLTDVSTRLDRAADHAQYWSWAPSASDLGQKLDRIAAGMTQTMTGATTELASVPSRLAELEQTAGRIVSMLNDLQPNEAKETSNLPSLLDRLERLAVGLEGVVARTDGAPAMFADLRAALADQTSAQAALATTAETLARRLETALGAAREERSSDLILEAVAASSRELDKAAAALAALGQASDHQKEATAAVARELAELRVKIAPEDPSAAEIPALSAKLEALETQIVAAIKTSDAVRADLGALPEALAAQLRALADSLRPTEPADPERSDDPPARASELSAGVGSLREHIGALADRVETALTTIGRAGDDDRAQIGEARAGIGRLLDTVQALQGLILPLVASPTEADSKQANDIASRLEDMNDRLDKVAERVDRFMDLASATIEREADAARERVEDGRNLETVAEAMAASTHELRRAMSELAALGRAADLHNETAAGLSHQIEALSGRIAAEEQGAMGARAIAERLETLEMRIGAAIRTSDTVLSEVSALPEQIAERLSALAPSLKPSVPDLSEISNDPPARASEVSAGVETLRQEIGALSNRVETAMTTLVRATEDGQTRIGEAQVGLARLLEVVQALQAAMEPRAHEPLATLSPSAEVLPTRFEDMNARLDQFVERIEQIVDHAGARETRLLAPSAGAGLAPASAYDLSNQIEELAARLDEVIAALAALTRAQSRVEPVFKQSLAPLQERLVASAEASELGFQRIAAQVARYANVLAATPNSLIAEARNILANHRVDLSPLQRSLDKLGYDLRTLAEGQARANGDPPAAPISPDTAAIEALSQELRAEMDELHRRLDHFVWRIDQVVNLLGEADASRQTLQPVPTTLERAAEETLSQRLDQFQSAVAKTLFELESRWEQPLAELRAGLASLAQLAAARASVHAVDTDDAGSRKAEPATSNDTLVAALKTMKRFMTEIEKRSGDLETLAGAVKTGGPDGADSRALISLDEQIGEMRRLTGEFLEISSAIGNELAQRTAAA